MRLRVPPAVSADEVEVRGAGERIARAAATAAATAVALAGVVVASVMLTALPAIGGQDEPGDERGDRVAAGASVSAPVFVSLTAHARQVIPPGQYTLLRFDGEAADAAGWHPAGSTVITPRETGTAMVCHKVTWEDSTGPQQYYVEIIRDPGGAPDATGAEDFPNTPGLDYEADCWAMVVRAGQPLGIRVRQDGPAATAVTFAEFKVAMFQGS